MLNHQNYQHMNHLSFESTSSGPITANPMDSQPILGPTSYLQSSYAQPHMQQRPRIADSQHQLDQFSSSVDTGIHPDETTTNASGSQANIVEVHAQYQSPTHIPVSNVQSPYHQPARYIPEEESVQSAAQYQPNKLPNNINEGASTVNSY